MSEIAKLKETLKAVLDPLFERMQILELKVAEQTKTIEELKAIEIGGHNDAMVKAEECIVHMLGLKNAIDGLGAKKTTRVGTKKAADNEENEGSSTDLFENTPASWFKKMYKEDPGFKSEFENNKEFETTINDAKQKNAGKKPIILNGLVATAIFKKIKESSEMKALYEDIIQRYEKASEEYKSRKQQEIEPESEGEEKPTKKSGKSKKTEEATSDEETTQPEDAKTEETPVTEKKTKAKPASKKTAKAPPKKAAKTPTKKTA